MSIPILLAVIALVLGLVVELQARGRDLVGWGVVCLALSLLWGVWV